MSGEIEKIFGSIDWPLSFRFENYSYDISNWFEARRKILYDMNIVLEYMGIGLKSPIDPHVGFNTCVNALTAIVLAELDEREKK